MTRKSVGARHSESLGEDAQGRPKRRRRGETGVATSQPASNTVTSRTRSTRSSPPEQQQQQQQQQPATRSRQRSTRRQATADAEVPAPPPSQQQQPSSAPRSRYATLVKVEEDPATLNINEPPSATITNNRRGRATTTYTRAIPNTDTGRRRGAGGTGNAADRRPTVNAPIMPAAAAAASPAPASAVRSPRDPRWDEASIERALQDLVRNTFGRDGDITDDDEDEDEDDDEDNDDGYRGLMFNPFMFGNDEDEDEEEDEDGDAAEEWHRYFEPGDEVEVDDEFLMYPAGRRAAEREVAAAVRRRGTAVRREEEEEEAVELTGGGGGGNNERRGGGGQIAVRRRIRADSGAVEANNNDSGARGGGRGGRGGGGRVRIVYREANPGQQPHRNEVPRPPRFAALAELMMMRREMGRGGEDGGAGAARARRMAGWMWQREQREQGQQEQQQQQQREQGQPLQQQQQQQQLQQQEQGHGPGQQQQQQRHHHRHHAVPRHNPMMMMPRFGAIMNDLSALHQALAGAQSGALPPALLFSDRDFTDADYEMLLALDDRVENRRGATQQDIDEIETVRVPRNGGINGTSGSTSGGRNKNNNNNKNRSQHQLIVPERCAICLEDCKANEMLRKMKCGHAMHKVCLDKWLKTRAVCPICLQHI